MRLNNHLVFWTKHLCGYQPLSFKKITYDEERRIENYIKLQKNFSLSKPLKINSVSRLKSCNFSYDWYSIFSKLDQRLCNYEWGDVTWNCDEPTFVKSREISEESYNNILLPLDTYRHFNFHTDFQDISKKIPNAVWRGAVCQKHREIFLERAKSLKCCDVANTSKDTPQNIFGKSKFFLSISKQLKSKFIFAIEGNDVASNLKWIMASNSIPIMPSPKFETWFCESMLEPGRHFICIKKDFSDIKEKIEYYLNRPKLCEEINEESKEYASKFFDKDRQYFLASIVAERYFELQRS